MRCEGMREIGGDVVKGYALTVYGNAEPAGSKRAFYNQKTRRSLIVDANPKSREWKNLVAQEAGRVTKGFLEGALLLEATFYRPRPASHFGKGKNSQVLRASAPAFPISRPDTTKLLRAIEDALQGIWYADDSQIVDQHVRKVWGSPARVEVRVQMERRC